MTMTGGLAAGPTKGQWVVLMIARVVAVGVYVSFCVVFLNLYFEAIQLAAQAGASPAKTYLLDCDLGPSSSLLECAVEHVSRTANLATGMVGITAGAIPAIIFARERWELISAGLAILSGFAGMITIKEAESQTVQLIAVVGLLVVSTLFTVIAPTVLRLKEHAVRKNESGDAQLGQDQAARLNLVSEFEARVKQTRLIETIPNGVIVLGGPAVAAAAFLVILWVHG